MSDSLANIDQTDMAGSSVRVVAYPYSRGTS